MDSKHKNLAIGVIGALRSNRGLMTQIDFQKHEIIKLLDFRSDKIVFGYLSDLELIDISEKGIFRLTNKGWNFKSFEKLEVDEKIKSISTKTLIITAIITVLINLLQIVL